MNSLFIAGMILLVLDILFCGVCAVRAVPIHPWIEIHFGLFIGGLIAAASALLGKAWNL
jgi:hypothetical protein